MSEAVFPSVGDEATVSTPPSHNYISPFQQLPNSTYATPTPTIHNTPSTATVTVTTTASPSECLRPIKKGLIAINAIVIFAVIFAMILVCNKTGCLSTYPSTRREQRRRRDRVDIEAGAEHTYARGSPDDDDDRDWISLSYLPFSLTSVPGVPGVGLDGRDVRGRVVV